METPNAYRVQSNTEAANVGGLTERVDLYRMDASRQLDAERRSKMGQFFTPPLVARFMASLFGDSEGEIRLLDAGPDESTAPLIYPAHFRDGLWMFTARCLTW